jgi:hypothetical protein
LSKYQKWAYKGVTTAVKLPSTSPQKGDTPPWLLLYKYNTQKNINITYSWRQLVSYETLQTLEFGFFLG